MKTAHEVLPQLLAELEEHGVAEFRWLADPLELAVDPVVRSTYAALDDVGVDHAHAVLSKEGGGFSLVVHKLGGFVGAVDVVKAVETEAWKQDNRRKLAAMETDERHLFVWIDLSKEHYGIHGTPEPSTIGKTQSHGCIRLTNWDAAELADMVAAGTPAILQE